MPKCTMCKKKLKKSEVYLTESIQLPYCKEHYDGFMRQLAELDAEIAASEAEYRIESEQGR
jgi:demethoxyubiquinone hydroxylase (CLK1/Coq7/Cat5 family)